MNNIWIFGDSAGIDFNNLSNPMPIVSSMDGRGSSISMADTNGQLLFYSQTDKIQNTVSTWVYNRLHQEMQDGDSIAGQEWYNELTLIPNPKRDSTYYLFSYVNPPPFPFHGLHYSIIDLKQNNGLGQVVSKNNNINTDEIADCLQAVKHGNGRDWWLISKLSKQTPPNQFNRFFVYLITPDSIHAPLIQDFNDAFDVDFQKIIFHPEQDKFMLINLRGYMKEYGFDRCDGSISLINSIYNETPSGNGRFYWEGAYSTNGNIFYTCITMLTSQGQDTAYLVQYNLSSSNIPLSADTLESWVNPIGPGALRLAPDGKIYFSRAYQCNAFPSCAPYPDSVRNYVNENLSVINHPDSLGSACDYQPFSFHLGGKRTYYGLPNNPNYELGPLAGSLCDTITSVGIEPNKANFTFTLYPNPSYNQVTLNLNSVKQQNATLSIYNNIGALLLQKPITLQSQSLNLTKLPAGVYFVRIEVDEYSSVQKLIKLE